MNTTCLKDKSVDNVLRKLYKTDQEQKNADLMQITRSNLATALGESMAIRLNLISLLDNQLHHET